MRLYRTAAGHWHGTQDAARADAGRDWQQIEVPTDKPGLLAWLNEQGAPPSAKPAPFDDAPLLAAPPTPAKASPDSCAKCARTPRAAETLAQGDDVEAIGAWLWQAAPWQLERLFAVIGARVGELRR